MKIDDNVKSLYEFYLEYSMLKGYCVLPINEFLGTPTMVILRECFKNLED